MAVYEINSLTIQKGTDFEETFNIFNEDGTPLGINTSFIGTAKLAKYPSSPTKYPFNVYLSEENSTITLSMASTMTSQLPSGRCHFDVLLSYGFAETTTKEFIKGTIIVQDTTSL
jgi:hypothetical protein